MPAPSEHVYKVRKVRIIFACASLALLGSIIWLIKVDYSRPWRRFQDDFADRQATLAYLDYLQGRTPESEKRYRQLSSRLRRTLLNLPLLDFLAPKDTPGKHAVRQIVLPDVRVDLHFTETYQTDRCITCHLAIDNRDFTKGGLAHRFEAAIPAIKEHLQEQGQSLAKLDQPLLAHPSLDLFVAADSPHPMNKMGCTVCHEGNGEETDFVLAAHAPPSPEIRQRWKQQYYVRTAGLVPEHTFETATAGWDRPMHALKYLEASCTKCHDQLADISMHDSRPSATRINEGRFLVTWLGCVNCHLVDGLADARRVGPDLTHVGEKLPRGFLHNWTWSPKDYRPSTTMPHSFLQENNDALSKTTGEDRQPELRTKTEVIAITEYLLGSSTGYKREMPPNDLWDGLKNEDGPEAKAAAERGRRLFGSLGCLACHAALAHRPDNGATRGAGEPLGAAWITDDLVAKNSGPGQHEDDIWDQAHERYDAMTYVDRAVYAMRSFAGGGDTIFAPAGIKGPIFTRLGPELSSIRSQFASYEDAVQWLYDWLINPRRYSSAAKMPRMSLQRGHFPVIDPETGATTGRTADAHEALDLAVYLCTFSENRVSPTQPFDADPQDAHKFADVRDELILAVLGSFCSPGRGRAILNDEDGQLTDMLVSRVSRASAPAEARVKVEAMNLEQRRWMLLGEKMIEHYGCFACHLVPGFERTARLGPDLANWGEKQLDQLDLGLLDPGLSQDRKRGGQTGLSRHLYAEGHERLLRWAETNPPVQVERTRASFAWHKVRNPRLWDRGQAKAPYAKLKMPNFFFTGDQADALVTFLLSRKPARVTRALQVDYSHTSAGRVAAGRHLARELNCIGCHAIDGNAAVIHQHNYLDEGGDPVFDEANAPPWLRGEGARVQGPWQYAYLNRVETIRPWLKVRMPSYDLTGEQATQLVEYFAGLSQQESKWLADALAPVDKYAAHGRGAASTLAAGDAKAPGWDWFRQDSLAGVADSLRRYAVANRLVPAGALDPIAADPEEFANAHQTILRKADYFRRLFDVPYPFTELPPEMAEQHELDDGRTVFLELGCLACHAFGDPAAEGANPNPIAPNLRAVYQRLRRDWVRRWLEAPRRIQPGTRMPNFFGEDLTSAFTQYPPEDRDRISARLADRDPRTPGRETILDDGPKQIEALIAFLFDASKRQLNVTDVR